MGPQIAAPSQSEGSSTPEQVRKQLEKITRNKLFARSERMRRFLSFGVEHALAGAGAEVKEYLVGTQVFDRPADYDPRVDPIVRVEAHRLRAKLKTYYSTAGKSDSLIIEFPRGAYLPVFRTRKAARADRPARTAKAIAVLPFSNLSTEPEGDYFSDGLTEELIHLLTRVSGLRVMAWTTASRFRGGEQDLPAVRTRLQVDAILRGSVRRNSGRVRVTAQLVDTESGAYLWSEAFDRDTHDMLAIEQEIAQAIVSTLRLALAPAARPHEIDVDCYNLCLRGRFHAHRRTAEGLRRSVECFEQAIAKDPQSAAAYAGLADSYSLLADYGVMRSDEVMLRAREAAETALRLDPESAEALCSLAFVRSLYEWRWSEAEALYRRALAVNPGYSRARHWFAIDYLALRGRFDEAAEEIRIARSLDPLSVIIHENSAYLRTLRRDYDGAAREFEQLIELDPEFYKAYSGLGRVLSLMGRYDEALEKFDKSRGVAGNVPSLLSAKGQTLALAGRAREARECLDELAVMARERCVPSSCFAILHLGLGEFDRSLDWIEGACERRELQISALKVHPVYDPLRGKARFRGVLRRMGM